MASRRGSRPLDVATRQSIGASVRSMNFVIFAPLAFILLRLTFRWRWRTILLTSVVIGLAADFILDSLVALRR